MSIGLRSGPAGGLDPGELAAAAVMASVCVGLVVLGSVVPHAGPLQFAAVVPFGIVAHRHRVRALIASLVAAAFIAALVLGVGSAVGLAVCAALGGLVGQLKRRGRGVGTVVVAAAVLAPLAAVGLDLLLLVFAPYRRLLLQSVQSTLRGLSSTLHQFGPLGSVGSWLDQAGTFFASHWAGSVAVVVLIATPAALLVSWLLIGEVLERLRWVAASDLSKLVPGRDELSRRPAPLPVDLRGVSVRYGAVEALTAVDLRVSVGQFIAVVGDNGSGKSTLARLLAGVQPTAGMVERGGPVGLGRSGGTALIGQRPDAQVLGLRVADDVVWGLPTEHGADVEDLLATVGLAGMATRDTSSLSGGELQRLAVAAALARRPRLLISDESTAMIDPAGRRELTRLFAELPRRWPMTVVHITHNDDEVAAADRVVRLETGRVVSDFLATSQARPVPPPSTQSPVQPPELTSVPVPGTPVGAAATEGLRLRSVGHSYAYRTVWEHRALDAITLSIQPGEGVLVVGENGSGKSTLAWVLAGLIRPTQGACLLGESPTHRRRGVVGIGFQHARLQLQRPTVATDIADAAGWLQGMSRQLGRRAALGGELEGRVAAALAAVGLDPALAGRSIEELSGGQQRRVAVAGLLARRARVLVLDEPLAGLDAPSRSALVALLAELRERDGLTLIVVTHDPEPLSPVCPRTVRLDHGRVTGDAVTLSSPRVPQSEAA